MITPAQSKAARGLLDWSQTQLARRASLSESTIRDFEKGRRAISSESIDQIEKTFTSAGVTLIRSGGESEFGGSGVRFSRANIEDVSDVRSLVLSHVLNEMHVTIGRLENDLYQAINEDDELKKVAISEVRSRFQSVMDELHSEYNESLTHHDPRKLPLPR